MCLCVYMCVCVFLCGVFTSIYQESFICLEHLECQEKINDAVLEMLKILKIVLKISAKSLHCYFRMKHRAILASHFILFTLEVGKATT